MIKGVGVLLARVICLLMVDAATEDIEECSLDGLDEGPSDDNRIRRTDFGEPP